MSRAPAGEFTFSDFLNIFLFNQKYDLGAMIRALKGRGLFQSLAEPNLIAYNGQEASFLAGGEIPVPVVQGISNAVSIQYKEYGIRLNFRPTVAGDTIRIHVRPEVSTLDFPNGILLSGFRIPALSTRRAETDVELRDGQTFAMAGLLNNLSQDDIQEMPGLARLPIIGHLFRSKAERAEQTEFLVLITPQLIRPLNPDEVPPLPTIERRFLPRGGDHRRSDSGRRWNRGWSGGFVAWTLGHMRMYSEHVEGRCDSRNVCRLARPSGRGHAQDARHGGVACDH